MSALSMQLTSPLAFVSYLVSIKHQFIRLSILIGYLRVVSLGNYPYFFKQQLCVYGPLFSFYSQALKGHYIDVPESLQLTPNPLVKSRQTNLHCVYAGHTPTNQQF